MITEDYVSFEIAKLLKEKGFEGSGIFIIYDENAANAYIKELQEKHLPYSSDDPKLKEFYYTKPTLQMAMKWLREIHNLHIVPKKDFYGGFYTGRIYDDRRETITDKDDYIACSGYDKYEDATEAAIKYCLENLI